MIPKWVLLLLRVVLIACNTVLRRRRAARPWATAFHGASFTLSVFCAAEDRRVHLDGPLGRKPKGSSLKVRCRG